MELQPVSPFLFQGIKVVSGRAGIKIRHGKSSQSFRDFKRRQATALNSPCAKNRQAPAARQDFPPRSSARRFRPRPLLIGQHEQGLGHGAQVLPVGAVVGLHDKKTTLLQAIVQ